MKLGFKQIVLFGDPDLLSATIENTANVRVPRAIIGRFYEACEATLFYRTSEESCASINRAGEVKKNIMWPRHIPGNAFVIAYNKSTVNVYLEKETKDESIAFL
jgi:hypothetical protein